MHSNNMQCKVACTYFFIALYVNYGKYKVFLIVFVIQNVYFRQQPNNVISGHFKKQTLLRNKRISVYRL